MNADEVRELLKRKVEEAGSQMAFCRGTRINQGMVSRVLRGEKPPPTVLIALGLKKVITFEPIK